MTKELISVIIPVYNAERYLPKCVESVQNQTYQNIEIILIDDGSKDRSGILCEEYTKKDSRIKAIRQKNSGVSSTRNSGIKCAEGKYIAFIDADDYWSENYLECLWEKMQYPGVDLVLGAMKKVDEKGAVKQSIEINQNSNDWCWPIQNHLYISCWRGLFKRKIIIDNNLFFTLGCKTGEDQEFTFKYMLHANKITYSNQAIYYYQLHENSTMHQQDYRHFDSVNAMLAVVMYAEEVCLRDQTEIIKKQLKYYYIPSMMEFAILTVLTAGESPKQVFKYLKDNIFYQLLNESCIQENHYNSLFIKRWLRSPKKCLRKYYLRKKLGDVLRRLRIKR